MYYTTRSGVTQARAWDVLKKISCETWCPPSHLSTRLVNYRSSQVWWQLDVTRTADNRLTWLYVTQVLTSCLMCCVNVALDLIIYVSEFAGMSEEGGGGEERGGRGRESGDSGRQSGERGGADYRLCHLITAVIIVILYNAFVFSDGLMKKSMPRSSLTTARLFTSCIRASFLALWFLIVDEQLN